MGGVLRFGDGWTHGLSGSDLASSRQTLRPFYEMNYVLVPDNQGRVTIPFLDYPDESDLDGGTFPNGSYPVPSNMPRKWSNSDAR